MILTAVADLRCAVQVVGMPLWLRLLTCRLQFEVGRRERGTALLVYALCFFSVLESTASGFGGGGDGEMGKLQQEQEQQGSSCRLCKYVCTQVCTVGSMQCSARRRQ